MFQLMERILTDYYAVKCLYVKENRVWHSNVWNDFSCNLSCISVILYCDIL